MVSIIRANITLNQTRDAAPLYMTRQGVHDLPVTTTLSKVAPR